MYAFAVLASFALLLAPTVHAGVYVSSPASLSSLRLTPRPVHLARSIHHVHGRSVLPGSLG